MSYTKLFNSIITSTIWTEDDKTRILWITMLALADKNGEVQASIPGLARVAGMSVECCEVAIGKFLAPDPYSRTPDDEGRRIEVIDGGWALLNHGKYREMASREEQKEAEAERKRRYRERLARNGKDENVPEMSQNVPDMSRDVPKTLHIAEADTEAEADTKEEEEETSVCVNSLGTHTHTDLPLITKINSTHSAYTSPALSKSEREHFNANREYLESIHDDDWEVIAAWMKARVDWKPKNRMQLIANIDQCHTYAIDWRRKNPPAKPKAKQQDEQQDPDWTPEKATEFLKSLNNKKTA